MGADVVFPSPALSSGIHTPSLESEPPSSCSQSPGPLKRPLRLDDSAVALPPEPGHVPPQSVTMPLAEDATDSNTMNLIVGGALAPTHDAPPNPPRLSRPGPGLKLPSFQALGIMAPHPDRFGSLSVPDQGPGAVDGSASDFIQDKRVDLDLLAAFGATTLSPSQFVLSDPGKSLTGGGRAVATAIRHDVATLTPPAETGEPQWPAIKALSSVPQDSSSTDPVNQTSVASPSQRSSDVAPASQSIAPSATSSKHAWVEGALNVLLENLRTASVPSNPLRVLSHALPSPAAEGHIYPTIIDAIHCSTPASPTVWINVFHAIQGRFNLADLPTSPPSTPGPPIGGDDYFTQKVFDSAVPISDYQEDLSSLPRSPRPVVPPSSINISIVERYIPPTSANEFRDMFDPSGPSLLVDRLVELSPYNGSLAFVYPTKAGAETFLRDYLGPILDPTLRAIQVTNGLSSDLGRTLGTMAAAHQLPDYDQMLRSMTRLCASLTQRSTSIERFHGRRATFALAHASKENVVIARDVWAKEWWAKQEKPRIRAAMSKFTQEAQKKSSNEHVERSPTPTELVQLLLREVAEKPYVKGQEPKSGIEVSVFVIKRLE